MKDLKLTKQQFKEIVDAYDIYVDEVDNFLNIETGEVVTILSFEPSEEMEELNEIVEEGFNEVYFRIPYRDSREGYSDMVDFVATIEDPKLRAALEDILSGGKRIFRRFKDELSYDKEQMQRYYLFTEERSRLRVMEWLDSIGVKVILA